MRIRRCRAHSRWQVSKGGTSADSEFVFEGPSSCKKVCQRARGPGSQRRYVSRYNIQGIGMFHTSFFYNNNSRIPEKMNRMWKMIKVVSYEKNVSYFDEKL